MNILYMDFIDFNNFNVILTIKRTGIVNLFLFFFLQYNFTRMYMRMKFIRRNASYIIQFLVSSNGVSL